MQPDYVFNLHDLLALQAAELECHSYMQFFLLQTDGYQTPPCPFMRADQI